MGVSDRQRRELLTNFKATVTLGIQRETAIANIKIRFIFNIIEKFVVLELVAVMTTKANVNTKRMGYETNNVKIANFSFN